MSIATLKNKTFKGGASPRVNPISSNGIFALNGTRRIRGVVGNTNLAPGNYSKTGVRSSCCADGETEVKLSVKNTRGMLSQRYDQLYYGEKCHVVQLTTDDSSSYIKKLHTINTCSFLKFKPGLVGGHCLPVDPYYFSYISKKNNFKTKITLAGRYINDSMEDIVCKKIKRKLNSIDPSKNKKVLICGLSYKKNVLSLFYYFYIISDYTLFYLYSLMF